jgi:hypothetical protein
MDFTLTFKVGPSGPIQRGRDVASALAFIASNGFLGHIGQFRDQDSGSFAVDREHTAVGTWKCDDSVEPGKYVGRSTWGEIRVVSDGQGCGEITSSTVHPNEAVKDFIEAFVLAMGSGGYDVGGELFQEALSTAFDALSNNAPDDGLIIGWQVAESGGAAVRQGEDILSERSADEILTLEFAAEWMGELSGTGVDRRFVMVPVYEGDLAKPVFVNSDGSAGEAP